MEVREREKREGRDKRRRSKGSVEREREMQQRALFPDPLLSIPCSLQLHAPHSAASDDA